MSFSPNFDFTRRRIWGLMAALGMHALVGWVLTRGSVMPVVQLDKPAVQVTLVSEAPPAPKPPPPQPPLRPPQQPAESVEPKVAPIEKMVATAASHEAPPVVPPLVQAADTEIPSPAAITPTLPVPPQQVVLAAPVAPPKPPVAPTSATAQTMGLVCSKQVQPVMPRRAAQEGINGRVEARATVRAGRVVAVEILSAKPRGVFELAVKQAMLQYQCDSNAPGDVMADQVFEFKLDQ